MGVLTPEIPAWRHRARLSPNATALTTPQGEYSWKQLCEQVSGCAMQLKTQGVEEGRTVLLVGKNRTEMVVLFLASLELGAKCAFAMPQPYATLQKKVTTLFGEKRPFLWLSPIAQGLFSESEHDLMAPFILDYALEPGINCIAESHLRYDPDNLATIVFTSGSTGVPKAVAHTSAQHFASASGLLEAFQFTEKDTWLLSLPIYHVSGLAILYRWLYAGACLKVGTGDIEQDINSVTHASLVATQLKRLLDSGITLALNHVLLGGGHIPLSLSQQAAAKGIETWLGYGMTEAASTVTAKQVDEAPTAGRPLPNRKVKLFGQRIYIGGETLASGYYYQGSLTPICDAEGWYDSKDLGEWLNGELRIIGRADNQFISGGENIHCEEIETVLVRHPDITQAVVLPVKSEEFGQRPVAFVQTDSDISKLELKQWMEDKIVRFKIPDAFYTLPELSKGNIKISRMELKRWYQREVQNSHRF